MEKVIPNTFLKERLSQEDVKKFITFPGEKLIVALREHYISLLLRVGKVFSVTLVSIALMSVPIYLVLHDIPVLLFTFFLVFFAGTSLILKEIVHWYFHLYIITNRKILEIHYDPLFSEVTNSVLLDQIRCTEIDVELYGFISQLLNIGNVEITFDRPTHQEEFVLRNIHSPRKISDYLSAELHRQPDTNSQQLWYKNKESKYQYLERDRLYGNLAN